MKQQIITNYRDDRNLRDSFNQLAEQTFGINFENWYQNGYWTDAYNPVSIVEDGRVLANVSVNDLWFDCDGATKHYLQLGTVMTDPAYRGQGLCRRLMEQVLAESAHADGIFLFANDSVLDFYPKFGFVPAVEYVHEKTVSDSGSPSAILLPMKGREDWEVLERAITESVFNSSFGMLHNVGLTMFYATQFMCEAVYRIEAENAVVIAEVDDGVLHLHEVFAPRKVNLEEIFRAFGSGIHTVRLGFTPCSDIGYRKGLLKEENTTLFVRGIPGFSEKQQRFPVLSHA